MKKIELGDEVIHKHTGFKGVAVSRTTYLSGCDRITIQPKVRKDGSFLDSLSFDEPEIKITKSKNIKITTEKTGGWQPSSRHYLNK